MKYKMIASDFDGTIKHDVYGVSERTLKVITDYIERGGLFYLVTGRMYSSAKPKAEQLGLHGLMVACQGTQIYDIDTDELVFNLGIETMLASKIIKYLEEHDKVVQIYVDDGFFAEKPNIYTDYYMQYCTSIAQYSYIPLSEYVVQNNIKPVKIVCFMKPEENLPFQIELDKVFGDVVNTSRSQPTFLEIIDKHTDKGTATLKLAELNGLTAKDVMAFGDANNDVSMIKSAGFGVAVGNAMPDLKEAADYVCDVVEKDGVARTIIEQCFDTTYEEYFKEV